MKRFLLILLLLPWPAAADNTLVVPGKSVGPITPQYKRADLVKAFGAANVKDAKIPVGEGETTPGVVVFPKDPKRRLEITWVKSKRVGDIRFTGQSSLWHTADGITLGTTLAQLQELNGVPFKFSGFGWDYGGTVLSWEKGKLEKSLKNVWLTLDPSAEASDYQGVIGDGSFLSSDVLKKSLPIAVWQIRVELNRDP